MRVAAVLRLSLASCLALGLAACGGGVPTGAGHAAHAASGSPSPLLSTPPSVRPSLLPLPQARHAWKAAVKDLVASGSGTYTWAAGTNLGSPLESERGSFAFDPERASIERTLSAKVTQGSGELVARVRALPSGYYLQMRDWRKWDGCWLRMANSEVSGVAAQAFGDGYRPLHLPLSIASLLAVRITGVIGRSGAAGMSLEATINGLSGLRLLGLELSGRNSLGTRASAVRVPVTVNLAPDGSVVSLSVIGLAVQHALDAQQVPMSTGESQTVASLIARSIITGTGQAFTVDPPAAETLLPKNASGNGADAPTCSAHRAPGT